MTGFTNCRRALYLLCRAVAPHDTLTQLRREVDRIDCRAEPDPFRAIGLHYEDFTLPQAYRTGPAGPEAASTARRRQRSASSE